MLVVSNYFLLTPPRPCAVERIRFDDGTVLSIGEIKNIVLAGTEQSDRLTGYGSDDVLNGGGGNDHLQGMGGNDIRMAERATTRSRAAAARIPSVRPRLRQRSHH